MSSSDDGARVWLCCAGCGEPVCELPGDGSTSGDDAQKVRAHTCTGDETGQGAGQRSYDAMLRAVVEAHTLGLCPVDGPCDDCDCHDPHHDAERAEAQLIVTALGLAAAGRDDLTGDQLRVENDRLTREVRRLNDEALLARSDLLESLDEMQRGEGRVLRPLPPGSGDRLGATAELAEPDAGTDPAELARYELHLVARCLYAARATAERLAEENLALRSAIDDQRDAVENLTALAAMLRVQRNTYGLGVEKARDLAVRWRTSDVLTHVLLGRELDATLDVAMTINAGAVVREGDDDDDGEGGRGDRDE